MRAKLQNDSISCDIDQTAQKANSVLNATLVDACRVRLGRRFYFELATFFRNEGQDFELRLVDQDGRDTGYRLAFRSFRRSGKLIYVASMGGGPELGSVELNTTASLNSLSNLLKSALKEFLEAISGYLLNPSPQEDQDFSPNPRTEVKRSGGLSELDFFDEARSQEDNTVSNIEDIEPIQTISF